MGLWEVRGSLEGQRIINRKVEIERVKGSKVGEGETKLEVRNQHCISLGFPRRDH